MFAVAKSLTQSSYTLSTSDKMSDEDEGSLSSGDYHSSEPTGGPDMNCREVINIDHPFLKYAVKLGYEAKLAEDALSRLGAQASTDSLLKAVLYSYAALNPNKRSRHNRSNRNHYLNRNNTYNRPTHPSYMVTQDSYQRFNGYHPEVTALKSALTQSIPIQYVAPQLFPRPDAQRSQSLFSDNMDNLNLNADAQPFQPFSYWGGSSPDSC